MDDASVVVAEVVEWTDAHRKRETCGEDHLQEAYRKIGRRGQSAIDQFFESQRVRALQERKILDAQQALKSQVAEKGGAGPVSPTAWNQQEMYLDIEKFQRARLASCQHLAQYHARFQLGVATLRDLVALQHYVDSDLEDLCLPWSSRRSQDIFGGRDGNVCQQLLLDATRSTFTVDNEVFDFARESQNNTTLEEDFEKRKQTFCDRLVAAVMKSLGQCPPAVLVRAVTTMMSQSGLANVERGCESPQIVVCGGESNVSYELTTHTDGIWDLRLSVHKYGFDQCMICDSSGRGAELTDAENQDIKPIACRQSSFVLKEMNLRVSVSNS